MTELQIKIVGRIKLSAESGVTSLKLLNLQTSHKVVQQAIKIIKINFVNKKKLLKVAEFD